MTVAPATRSKSELSYTWIRSKIEGGAFVPGYRLVLGAIAKELDVSVVPVREAIRRLEAEGLVTFERNVGAQVAMLNETGYVTTMQTLSILEGAATMLSAPFITDEDIAAARAVNANMADCLENFDPHRFTELNREFHSILFERCPNDNLLDLVHRGWNSLNMLRDSTFSFVPGRAHQSVAEHEGILSLLENGADSLDIELAARAHRTRTLDAFTEYQSTHKRSPVQP
ncbi:GntR family transcriptional regulator [Mycetocola manganoxydans]|uniref:GntR family transcriptional regulator n=1 Tax=Mycetocola manganoxydans TaxID=699879 RepID=A0A3L7A1V4_9MICO|nr:GntR family transcriptional regulator [Mycetocola manganoxydans]RLP73955.1 GntR family transcriptional regulator [Mycetocola manganoxydans]GHD42159.1 GntR family transcriptional regulator [Mycetocola manganoxydans]